jgi:glycerol-3-phosphate cytidylyltransferase
MIGVVAGNFDVIHPGYIAMFNEMKLQCDYLIVLLHSDPTIERPSKCKPILSVDDRIAILHSLKQIDEVVVYTLESELYAYLEDNEHVIGVRFLGDDYINKSFTGDDLNIPIYYINRDHGWSTSKFKKQIANEIFNNSNI